MCRRLRTRDMNSDTLDTVGPLPMVALDWRKGWCDPRPRSTQLDMLYSARSAMCRAVFAFRNVPTGYPDVAELQTTVAANNCYVELLVAPCTGQLGTGQRTHPLEFEWCFPAEVDPMRRLNAATMRSVMPAYELACVAAFSCIAYSAAGIRSSECDRHLEAIHYFECCARQCDATIRMLLGETINAAQWARLRRQGLPLQIMPAWLRLLSAKVAHRAQICALRAVSTLPATDHPDRGEMLTQLARGARFTSEEATVRARVLLLDHKFLLPTQVHSIEATYTSLVTEVHRIRVQCAMQDADLALYGGRAAYTGQLLREASASAVIAFDNEPGKLKTVMAAVAETMHIVVSTCSEAQGSTDESHHTWRNTLPSLSAHDIYHELTRRLGRPVSVSQYRPLSTCPLPSPHPKLSSSARSTPARSDVRRDIQNDVRSESNSGQNTFGV